jgi:hypothetical protein
MMTAFARPATTMAASIVPSHPSVVANQSAWESQNSVGVDQTLS